MFEKITDVIAGICWVLIAWGVLSWIDIIADNLSANPQHSAYNLFILLFG